MKDKLIGLVCLVTTLVSVKTLGWGFSAHQHINRCAVFTLPPTLFTFYKHYVGYLVEHAIRPDKRKYVVQGEDGKHYIDLDYYKDQRLIPLPQSWTQALEQYPKEILGAHGTVPWHIAAMKHALTQAFIRQDVGQILKLSADIGHYIADANVPLHTTQNYNGQLTGQEGIHSFWETRLPELFLEEYDCFVGKATYVSDPQGKAWEAIEKAHQLVSDLLQKEKKLSQVFSGMSKFSYERRGTTLKKVYSMAYAKAYHDALAGQVECQLRAAIRMVGDFWFTCWMDAGAPALDASAVPPVGSIEEPIEEGDGVHNVRECGD